LPFALTSAPRTIPPPAALGAIIVLGALCTALGLLVFFSLIAEAGPRQASVITYVNPLVAVVAAVVALGERVGAMSVAGLALILGGSWLSTRGRVPHSG
jgi:drug/metabolite transporter (DMT)-like permease